MKRKSNHFTQLLFVIAVVVSVLFVGLPAVLLLDQSVIEDLI